MGTVSKIYIYNEQTHIFEYEYEAQRNQKRVGYYLYPPNCTIIQPPQVNAYEAPKWNTETNEWTIIPFYTNSTVWNKETGEIVKVEPGLELTENQTVNYEEVSQTVRREPYEFNLKNEIIKYLEIISEQGVTYKNHSFQARQEDVNNVSLMIMKVQIGGEFYNFWRDRDNNWVEITFDELKELGLLIGNYWQNLFVKSRLLIDQLKNLTIEELKSYNVAERFLQ